jgi:N-methylhydantoinase A
MLLGVDTGGTFTDFVLFDGSALHVYKVLSTPQAPEMAILTGVAALAPSPEGLRLVHGSTVATNAVLEHKGVRTAFVTNRGLGDLLTIGRQARRALYDLQPHPEPPPVPRALCLETGGRMGADGTVIEPLTEEDLRELCARIAALAPQAVAINLLFSFLDDRAERAIEAALPDGVFVSRSSEVLPEYREYERGIATWLNAYVGPLLAGYVQRLRHGLTQASVYVMQSSGQTIAADQAGRKGVHLLLSGPAGGLMGARFVGRATGHERLLTFDMGGTSTDVALINGEVRLTTEGHIGPYPVAVSMVDMHTIGAGGGSIARVDAGGLLQVGPESAGAAPGPACYGLGGQLATVTDANLVLGRLRPEAFLGGAMRLDAGAARAALAALAGALGLGVEEAAEGVIRVANEHMARALRVISVERGIDPRSYTLTSFGGAGGLHVCALAEALGMKHAMVPVHAGVLSALGMLAAPRGRQLSRTLAGLLEEIPEGQLEEGFAALIAAGGAELAEEGVPPDAIGAHCSLDLRYRGQSYTLNVPWRGVSGSATQFHLAHERRYGHRLDVPVELVNLRAALSAPAPELRLVALPPSAIAAQPSRWTRLHAVADRAPVWERARLAPGQQFEGPALVVETVATTYLAPVWTCRVDGVGNLMLEQQ